MLELSSYWFAADVLSSMTAGPTLGNVWRGPGAKANVSCSMETAVCSIFHMPLLSLRYKVLPGNRDLAASLTQHPSKHETLNQCWADVVDGGPTLAQGFVFAGTTLPKDSSYLLTSTYKYSSYFMLLCMAVCWQTEATPHMKSKHLMLFGKIRITITSTHETLNICVSQR